MKAADNKNYRRTNTAAHAPLSAAAVLADVLHALGSTADKERISLLWSNWDMVLGSEIAPYALPLGSRRDILFIGTEDTALVQELQTQSAEILERVNAFMESRYFRKVRVSLQLNSAVLRTEKHSGFQDEPTSIEKIALLSGDFLAEMNPASPVARCYAHYAKK